VVAGAVGYRQAAQFAKAFRRHHGARVYFTRREPAHGERCSDFYVSAPRSVWRC